MSDLDIFDRVEDLHPDLQSGLQDHPSLGKILHHPLAIHVPYSTMMNAYINERYKHIQSQLKKYEEAEDWHMYIFTHERPYRFQIFLDVNDRILKEDYGDLVAALWIDSENIYQHRDAWVDVFRNAMILGSLLMDEEDWNRFIDLPETMTIYRGIQFQSQTEGLSWTLDRDKAIWFMNRWARKGTNPQLLVGKLDKEDVIAYYGGRGESEIVCFPEHVYDVEVINANEV